MAKTEKPLQHPFLQALPPATDYVTYLTLIEYNLKTDEDLIVLHEVLQDERLTTNIGWDLVLLLLPMLPQSEACLHTIAKLGNPREVVLKVTEALRLIDWEPESSDDGEVAEQQMEPAPANATNGPREATAKSLSVSAQQFIVLIDMLSILHPRIRTKFPSRFISTSLQAVIAAYNETPSDMPAEPMTDALSKLVLTLAGFRRPTLPPRNSTDQLKTASDAVAAAPDPEAQTDPVSEADKQIQKRLLQSFLTHVVERWLATLTDDGEDLPGLCFSGRVFDMSFPKKSVPGRKLWKEKLDDHTVLQARSTTWKKLLSLVYTIGLEPDDLLQSILEVDEAVVNTQEPEEEPPDEPSAVPLSPVGSVFLLAESQTRAMLASLHSESNIIPIFPEQALAMRRIIGSQEAGGMGTAGTEPEAVIDAVLALGLMALERNEVGEPQDDESLMQYLQTVSLLSANTPSPSLRFHAHMLTTSVLRSHPSEQVRLTFIRDTLEHCPYENLKASAVSWIKGETLEANPPDRNPSEKTISIFASPVALEVLGPFLFPDLTQELKFSSISESWMTFKAHLGFYLALLNFYYLLLAAKHLHPPLQVAALHEEHDIGGSVVSPLRKASQEYQESLRNGALRDEEGPHGVQHAMLDLDILNDVLDRIEQGVISMNAETKE